jgi:hypothetical protein
LLKERSVWLRRGGALDHWDLEIRGGFFACVRTRLGVEDYPGGEQYLRFRAWPVSSLPAAALAFLPMALSLLAHWQGASWAALTLALIATLLVVHAVGDCAAATTCLFDVLYRYGKSLQTTPATSTELDRTAATIETRASHAGNTSQTLAEISADDEIISVIAGGERP